MSSAYFCRLDFLTVGSLCAALLIPAAHAQTFRQGEVTFNAVRPLTIEQEGEGDQQTPKEYSVVVTEFFHHGEINPEGGNVLVVTAKNEPVATRVLQLGPGDYCRLAFQTAERQPRYDVFYGGEQSPQDLPPWTNQDGLLLETRKYKYCNPNSLEAVREAFESATPIGSDYVDGVHHSRNPFSLKAEPFLSRYSGHLHIASAGTYGFLTSSRDASFLLIDDQLVISAPGLHGPEHRAKRGTRKDVQLKPGAHKFDYYHLAAGPDAIMAAAWEVNPLEDKPKPAAIPPAAFRAERIGKASAGAVALRTLKSAPDYVVAIAGDVPLPDNPEPLIGVSFRNTSAASLLAANNAYWDFGDGQTSDQLHPDHVYLRPGLYKVSLTIRRLGRELTMSNRIYIDRPFLTRHDEKKFHKLDDYLTVLDGYNLTALDAASLRQLVEAYTFKAAGLENPEPKEEDAQPQEEKPAETAEQAPATPRGRTPAKPEPEPVVETPNMYYEKALAAGKVAFLDANSRAIGDDEELLKLARIISAIARNRLVQSDLAFEIWEGASRRIRSTEGKAECYIEAADIAINDLLRPATMKAVLEAADRNVGNTGSGALAARLACIWGDYYAATGDGDAARKAYLRAEQIAVEQGRYIERTAWRGAHSRSVEAFLHGKKYHRAVEQIRLWQTAFPTERIDGFLTIMYARYWAALEKWGQVVAQAEQLQAVNPDSPYVDQALVLAAEADVKRNRPDRAIATLRSLLNDYPGSPLVPEIKKTLAEMEAGQTDSGEKKNP